LRPNSPIMVILVAILVVTLFIIRGIPARQIAVNDGLPPGHQGNSSQKLKTLNSLCWLCSLWCVHAQLCSRMHTPTPRAEDGEQDTREHNNIAKPIFVCFRARRSTRGDHGG
jgi:hypothetical protein